MSVVRELGLIVAVSALVLLVGGVMIGGVPNWSARHPGPRFVAPAVPAATDTPAPPQEATFSAPAGGGDREGPGQEAEGATEGPAVVIGMTNTLKFQPQRVTIRLGQTVKWTNTSLVRHTVTADPEKATKPQSVHLPSGAEPFDSGLLEPNDTFTRTFRTPGTFGYFCEPHEGTGMRGEVVVK